MNKSKQLVDGALLSAIFVVLLLVSIYAPVISLFTAFLIGVPFVIYAARYDWKPTLVMLAVTIILTILFATIVSLPIPILSGLGGMMIGSAIYRNRSPYETLARGTLGFIAGILFSFVFTFIALDVNIISEFNTQIDQSMEMTKELISDFGMGEISEEQYSLIEKQIVLYKQLVPVFVVLAAILFALINQWVSYKILNRIERKKLRFPKFRNLRFPTAIIWIYLLTIIGLLFQNDLNETIVIALQNIYKLTEFLMVLQGFSFLFFYTHHKNLTVAIPVITIVISVLFAPLLLPLVRILGIIDLGFGLRERMVK